MTALQTKLVSPTIFALIIGTVILLSSNDPAMAQKYGRPQIPQNPNLLKQQAFDSYLSGEFEDAAIFYKKAIDAGIHEYGQNSTFVGDLYYELGTMSLEEGNFTRAARYLPLAVKMKPNSVQARVKLADLYLMQDKPEDAMGQIGFALKRNPGSVEAQKELVKLMMARAKSTGDDSNAASLACTWESFRLKNFSNNLLKQTNNLIANWQKRINSGDRKVPTISLAMSTLTKTAPPKPEPVIQKPAKIKPPQKPKPIVTPKPKVQPKPAKVIQKKPPVAAKPPPVEKPKPKPQQTRPEPVKARPKKSNGLVPPPPPTVPVYAPPPQAIKLETSVQVKKAEEVKKKPKPEPKKKVTKPSVPDEPDFILDWASKKPKKDSKEE